MKSRHRSSDQLPRLPGAVDVHFGEMIKQARIAANSTQQELAAALGVSFQQIQKYEKGTNRITASRLYQICLVLGVHISTMFGGLATSAPKAAAKTKKLRQQN